MVKIFAVIVFLWPLAVLMSILMFDSPSAGGIPVYMLFYAAILYGPVYLITLTLAFFLIRASKPISLKNIADALPR